RLAAGHYRVDRDLLDGCGGESRRHQPQHLLRIARGAVEHAQDALLGRRHQRQPVRPAAPEHRLLFVLILADLDAARFETGLVEAHLETLDDAGLDILGAASRALFGEAIAEPAHTSEALPLAAVPAIGTGDLAAALEADQGRHDLDLELKRDIERELLHRSAHGVGERRIV